MPEVGDNVEGIEGLQNGGVVANEIGEADGADEHVPHKDRGGEGVTNLVGAEPLNREKYHQNRHRYHRNHICRRLIRSAFNLNCFNSNFFDLHKLQK